MDIALRGLQPSPAELAALDDKLYGIDDEVAAGPKYDGRILDLASAIGSLPSPVMVRIGGEFSGAYKWYPGADVIDWYGIDWFDPDDFTGPLTDRGVETPHGRTRRFLDMAVAEGRPVVVAESSPARYDLSDPARAEAAWQEWFAPDFQILVERPEIHWFHLISYDWTRAGYYQSLGWENNDLTASHLLLERLMEELSKPRYLHAPELSLIS